VTRSARKVLQGLSSTRGPLIARFTTLVLLVAVALGSTAVFANGVPEPFAARYIGSKKIAFLTARAQATIELRKHRGHLRYTIDSVVRLAFYKRRFGGQYSLR